MTSCLLKLIVLPSFCFSNSIPDDVIASNIYGTFEDFFLSFISFLFCDILDKK